MVVTHLCLKYAVGINNFKVHNNRVWILEHDGSCLSFGKAWEEAELREFKDWYEFIKVKFPGLIERGDISYDEATGQYTLYGNQPVIISDLTILHRQDYNI